MKSHTRRCFICGEEHHKVLERHHLVPRRIGGDDSTENIVVLCANCHKAVEAMYNQQFFDRLKTVLREDHDLDTGTDQQELETVIGDNDYTCPLCGRETNRNGDPFSTVDDVRSHIHGSHDSQHEVDPSDFPDKITSFEKKMDS